MKTAVVFLLSLTFISCVSRQPQYLISGETSTFYVTISNKTNFGISVFPDNRIIPGGTDLEIRLPIQRNQLTEGYKLTCYVNIADDVIKTIPLENKIIKKEDKIVIIDDIHFVSDESFFVITNTSNSAVRIRRTNSDTYRRALGSGTEREGARIELRSGKTHVYTVDVFSCSIQNERDELFAIPQNIGKEGHVCYYTFDGSTVTLTDARPLHRVGESSWAKEIPGALAGRPLPIVTADNEIHLFASTARGLVRYVYTSAENTPRQVPAGEGFIITSAARAKDGFIVAGYERLADGDCRPVARIHDMNGTTRRVLEPSREYRTASFFTAAQKDNGTWLLAGECVRNGFSGNTVYARLVKEEDGGFTTEWERGINDFGNIGSGNGYGNIVSAVYDHAHDCWLVTGAALENYNIAGSYIAKISNSGTVQILRRFREMNFYKILADINGNCYLAGEEQEGNETYSVLVKYNLNNNDYRRISTRLSPHSYYNDAIFDIDNNRIILAGVLQARDGTGYGGVPFIEAVSPENDKQLWMEVFRESSDPSFRETSLATAIAPAPDYGFALVLSGISNEGEGDYYYEKPFVITRVNSQGKFFWRVP